MPADRATARRLWEALEPVHAQVYFAAEPLEALATTGLRGFWMGYVASRAGAMGMVGPDVVQATFFNFHPSLIRRALPDAWSYATPDVVLDARRRGATESLRRLLGNEPLAGDVDAAAGPLVETMLAAERSGRPLFAAHAGLAVPADPVGHLWFAATLLREHRGDGHVAALVTEGIGACEAHVLAVARGVTDAATQQAARQWSADDWATATGSLRRRDLVDGQGALTPSGRRLVDHIEAVTDRGSAVALAPLEERIGAVAAAAERLGRVVVHAGGVPFPNAMAYARPAWMDA